MKLRSFWCPTCFICFGVLFESNGFLLDWAENDRKRDLGALGAPAVVLAVAALVILAVFGGTRRRANDQNRAPAFGPGSKGQVRE